jgi:hypothetical protein
MNDHIKQPHERAFVKQVLPNKSYSLLAGQSELFEVENKQFQNYFSFKVGSSCNNGWFWREVIFSIPSNDNFHPDNFFNYKINF